MFLDFKEFNGGVVYMGNDSTCKMMGIGSIQIKMFDGVIRKLNDVRYVLDLKKKLIFLGVLDASGYCIILEGGNLKVARVTLVAIKGTRRGSRYYLNGTTIIGHAAVASSKEQDISKLWHMRLGHAGEKVLQTLVNQGVLKGATIGKIDLCEHCIFGKQKNVKFGTVIHQTKGILDYVHTDVWVPRRMSHWEERGGLSPLLMTNRGAFGCIP